MTRYNSNYGSHDQLQDLRKLNMELHHELDTVRRLLDEVTKELHQAKDEITLIMQYLIDQKQ